MQFISKRAIKIDKVLNELDKLVLDFTKVLAQHTKYVIVSGYVPILFGRTRATEDVDITIPPLAKEEFKKFYSAVLKSGYWFLNSSKFETIFNLLKSRHSVRVAKKGGVIPNIDLRFVQKESDLECFKNCLTVLISGHKISIAPLELQIAYKEIVLGSGKDKEDALHLRKLFEKCLDKSLIKKYKSKLLRNKEW